MNIKWKYNTNRFGESIANCYLRDFNASYTHVSEGIGHAEILYYPRKWKEVGKRPITLLSISEINIEKWSVNYGSFEDFLSQTMESFTAGFIPDMSSSLFEGFVFNEVGYLEAMSHVPVRQHADIYHCSAYRCNMTGEIAIPVSNVNASVFAGRRIGDAMTIFHSLRGRERFAVPTNEFLKQFTLIDYRLK